MGLLSLNRINHRVVRQHAEEGAHLWCVRDRLLRAPHVTLRDLRAHDRRIAAHLDGVAIANAAGWQLCQELLENVGAGETFTATVHALEARTPGCVEQMLAIAATAGDAWRGAASAFGWVAGDQVGGIVQGLVASDDASVRLIGIAACGMHRVDPGLLTKNQVADRSPSVRARALRTAGEIGGSDLVPALVAALASSEGDCRFRALWSAVLLGNRGAALTLLSEIGTTAGPNRPTALRLALQAMTTSAAHRLLQDLIANTGNVHWLIQGSGIAGDPGYVPWLINHMSNDRFARVAGEAFTLITGTKLAHLDLERNPPEKFESGPNDDPDDLNVDMDPDDGLPWPDPERVQSWWDTNKARFTPGERYFMGAPVTREHCIDVLKNGYQRQRILAAHCLRLLEPGTPLFNTSAPAWRQQRLLSRM